LKEKQPQYEKRDDKVILQHDNAYVAQAVKTHLETLKWEVLFHPLYSDIVLSDYYLFRSIIHGLSEEKFSSHEDTKKWIDSWIVLKDADFF